MTAAVQLTPSRLVDGLPAYGWGRAPSHLVTRRQMRAAGLAPGGADPVGHVVWGRADRRRALLWDVAELGPKRTPSAAQLAALGRAMAARRWCPSCRTDVGYCIRWSLGRCEDCPERGCA